MRRPQVSIGTEGVVLAVAANMWWGLSPIFWKQLSDFDAFTLIAQRVTWSFVALAAIQTVRRGWPSLRKIAAKPVNIGYALVSSTLLFVNWVSFVWAVNNERVTEAALGYFLLPLLSVLLARVVFREHLRPLQWVCVGLVAGGVLWLASDLGRVPWVALSLGFSFAIYGAIRKRVEFGSLDGLTLELSILVLPMLGYLVWIQFGDSPSIVIDHPLNNALLVATALMTTFPLLVFARAVRLIPLAVAGLIQYLNPTLQFVVGVWIYNEAFEGGQVVGYLIIWLGLIIFAVESSIVSGHQPRSVA